MSAEDREYLQQTARILVRSGYDPLEYIEESLLEMAGDSDGTLSERDLRIEARNALIRAVAELTQEQAIWPALTDYDRLKAALDTLETEGIVTRENFSCCGTCGAAEIGAEIEDFAAETGRPATGYVFFHQQDTQNAVDGHALHFNYGTASPDWTEAKSLAIGQRLFDALKSVGLTPDWDGTIDRRVAVSLTWQRRWEGQTPKPIKR
ncbi:hypothetical protein HPO_12833 [Hyphomonas polymorpha PS728]|uniref:DUF6891 domain-containing protein n=2 Tax=Hyphomonas polymorpha TaxID=74319 RepID=A0A062V795_9PROT|nr:hypothetical protein HPO_12833 [Hyphomonas polymorpha PS728]